VCSRPASILAALCADLCHSKAVPNAMRCLAMQYTESSMLWEISMTAPPLKDFLLRELRPLGVTSWFPARWGGFKVTASGTNLVGTLLIDM
jgi:hypothetical protein